MPIEKFKADEFLRRRYKTKREGSPGESWDPVAGWPFFCVLFFGPNKEKYILKRHNSGIYS
jgi:hypothetical protein